MTDEKIELKLFEILRAQFGFEKFRHGQLEAMIELCRSNHLLCIHPTGFGKSLLYQLPAMLFSGITLVISPLLALMRDQQNHLKHRFNIASGAINSDQTDEENEEVRRQAIQGALKILFVAPEQLDHVDRFQFLLKLPISMIVIDEAHCISTWGHDFRPSYRQILHFVQAVQQKYADLKILALTATADATTENDIKRQLTISGRRLSVIRESMDRPNICLSAFSVSSIANKLVACKQLLDQLNGCGLIYCATRENVELVTEYLKQQNVHAAGYHAGFLAENKIKIQKEFVNDTYKVLVATNALGMGIDKPNLRFIIHFDFPSSITAYYQEIGRCGRDGLESHGILLYDPKDKKIQDYFIESAQPSENDFNSVLKAVNESEAPPNLTTIKRLTGLHPTKVTVVVAELVEQGFLFKESDRGSQVYQSTRKGDKPNLERYVTQNSVKKEMLKKMVEYSEQGNQCRMKILREVLGDNLASVCKHCDVCKEGSLKLVYDSKALAAAMSWLSEQTVIIEAGLKAGYSQGVALLDGKLRSQMFVDFMVKRGKSHETSDFGISEELFALLQKNLFKLTETKKISCVIPIPSRTWSARNELSLQLGKWLNVPVFLDFLNWHILPEARQGELLNNDQRVHNVQNKMMSERMSIPQGNIILFDDYLGSGATIKEASRALRKNGALSNEIIPFTVAAIKWHLGKPGMV